MNGLKDVIKIKSILKKKTTETKDGSIHFGNYPHIGVVGKKMSVMPYQDTMRNWFIPIGVPYTIMSSDRKGLNRKYVAYGIGNELFVHKALYDKFLGDMSSQTLSIPVTDMTTSLGRSGWLQEEKEVYERLLWRLSLRSSGGDFQRISRIDFDTRTNVDKEKLERDGWVVNRVLGSNAYYGMTTVETRKQGEEALYWHNKYIVLLDMNSGSGMMIDGLMKWGPNPHPHVRPELNLCFGGYERPLYDHANRGEITKYFLLMKHFLGQYNPDSPTFKLPLNRSDRDNLTGRANKYFSKNIRFR